MNLFGNDHSIPILRADFVRDTLDKTFCEAEALINCICNTFKGNGQKVDLSSGIWMYPNSSASLLGADL